jgi:putative redox protein
MTNSVLESTGETGKIWTEFWKLGEPRTNVLGIHARVTLTHPGQVNCRQFAAQTGSGHSFLVDDAAGGTGPKPIELVAAALAGCTAFDVITILRGKKHQVVTGYEVHVEAEQAERPPQVFVAIQIHHVVRGHDVDAAAVRDAIRISEEKYCSVEAMLKYSAVVRTTFEVINEAERPALRSTLASEPKASSNLFPTADGIPVTQASAAHCDAYKDEQNVPKNSAKN